MDIDLFHNKVKPVRGAHGRFVKTLPTQDPQSPPDQKPQIHSDSNTFYADLSFYGSHIRRIFRNGSWMYAIIDLCPLLQITDPPGFMRSITQSVLYSELSGTHFESISSTTSHGTQENVVCADKVALEKLIIAWRNEGKVFPGPFMQWIENTSQITLEEQIARTSG